ncbi:hypothetical protein AC249_AIPGENE23934 [Exaiptasia diaphana]|nr:hypothetical protein AC249_AIPGENE23934 [Exaiptasia diaphana]
MEITDEEKMKIERDRVVGLLREEKEEIPIEALVGKYTAKYNCDLKLWKDEFVKIEAFLVHSCKAKA